MDRPPPHLPHLARDPETGNLEKQEINYEKGARLAQECEGNLGEILTGRRPVLPFVGAEI